MLYLSGAKLAAVPNFNVLAENQPEKNSARRQWHFLAAAEKVSA